MSGGIGNGPRGVEVGDSIMVVQGVYMPLIMQRQGVHHQLIGFAEVTGLVNGRLWNDDVDGETLVLR